MTARDPISPQDAVGIYAESRIAGASPGQLILIILDHVIRCCRNQDAQGARRGLIEIAGCLNLEHVEVAGPLYRLYEYCGDAVRRNDFDTALGVLAELRDAWRQAVQRVEGGAAASGEDRQA